MRLGILLALASAVLFGASTPFAKILLGLFDPWVMAGLLYIGAGLGLSVEHKGADWTALGTIQTASGARTSLFVPELDRLFVAERAGLLGSEAAIRVYRPTP